MNNKIEIAVRSVLSTYPIHIQKQLLVLRRLIFKVAREYPDLGGLTETLRWNESTYIPLNAKTGTSLRIAWNRRRPSEFGVFVNCNTDLIADFKKQHRTLTYQKTRAIIFKDNETVPLKEIAQFIRNVFTYNLK